MKKLQWLVIALLAVSLSSCAMFRQVPPDQFHSPTAGAKGEWECTGSKANGDWDCQRASDEEEASFAVSEPDAGDVAMPAVYTDETPTNSLQQVPVRVHRYEPPGTGTIQETIAQSGATSNARGDEPEYLWLSHRPDAPTLIENLPDTFYAVQLAAFSDMQKANNYASNASWLVEPRGVKTASGGKTYYVILLGIYETRTRAERAVSSISKHIGSDKPWIRSMTSLKPAIRAANGSGGGDRL
ncbi:MAG: SPOR domain-containing protein [Gammaproteobacteria bacterium]|nr:SPOR domain-containing protein [Gammaproteobacteria bacterium]